MIRTSTVPIFGLGLIVFFVMASLFVRAPGRARIGYDHGRPPVKIAPLEAAERLALARRHAPELRFNAWYPDDDASPHHRNEDYLPMSVDRFAAALREGTAHVVVRPSERARPARARRVRFRPVEPFAGLRIGEYPPRMIGDPPGAAPTYADVYAEAPGSDVWYVEYWTFHPYDHGDARVAGLLGGLGGHRADWEHVTLKLEVAPGAAASRIESAVYYGHDRAILVPAALLELVEGAHPAVYVSQGKHASYPEPGEWRGYVGVAIRVDDVFHGNGVRIPTWKGEIVDISHVASPRPAWLEWPGPWGPDKAGFLGVTYGFSGVGPWWCRESNDRFAWVTGTWTGAKATERGLRCDRDRGVEAPRVDPPPVPVVEE